MEVIIGCEYSGIVRSEFEKLGHNVISCDLLDTDIPGNHYKGDIKDILYNKRYDLGIFFPPCTRLTNSVIWYIKRNDLWNEVDLACDFFNLLKNAPINKICLENPLPHGIAQGKIGKYSQIIQPYNFGENASKKTCLWLKNLPQLKSTLHIAGKIVNGKQIWDNQTPGGWNKLGPSPERAKLRSKTYPGIARAMAEQWG